MIRDEDLFDRARASHETVNGKSVEKFVGEDAARQVLRQFIDPFDIEASQKRLLTLPHRRTALQRQISKPAASQDVSRKNPFTGAKLHNGEVIEVGRPLLKLPREKFSENRIKV